MLISLLNINGSANHCYNQDVIHEGNVARLDKPLLMLNITRTCIMCTCIGLFQGGFRPPPPPKLTFATFDMRLPSLSLWILALGICPLLSKTLKLTLYMDKLAHTIASHLYYEWNLCLQQRLWDHGWGTLLKTSAEEEKHFSLDRGVLTVESLCCFLLESTKRGLWWV